MRLCPLRLGGGGGGLGNEVVTVVPLRRFVLRPGPMAPVWSFVVDRRLKNCDLDISANKIVFFPDSVARSMTFALQRRLRREGYHQIEGGLS